MTIPTSKVEARDGESNKDNDSGYVKKKGSHFSKSTYHGSTGNIKFDGKCNDLKGYIYDCSDSKQSDIFATTTKEIAGYVGRTYKYGGDMRIAVDSLETPVFDMPTDPPEYCSRTALRIWEKGVDEHVKRITYFKENIKTLYSLVWGQCTDIMQQKIEASEGFERISATGDGMTLLKAIKNVAYQFQSQKYLPHSIYETKKRFYAFFQGRTVTTQLYYEKFQNMVNVIRETGKNISDDSGVDKI